MVDFTINNILLTPLSVSDIPDTIATSGEQTSLEIKGLSPVIPAAPWQVNWSDNFTGHQVQTIVRFQGLQPYTQIGARDRSYHLERRYIFGTFQGPFPDVVDLLLAAGECLNWFPFPEIRLSADNLAKIVNVYLQGQTAKEGIIKAIGQLGIQAEVKVRVDTGFLEIASSDQAEPAPIPLLDVDLLYTNCPEERRIIFDLVQNRAFLPASEVTVLGRLGIYANASGENNTRNEFLVYKSDGTLVTYDTLDTADRVLSILVEISGCLYPIINTIVGDIDFSHSLSPSEGEIAVQCSFNQIRHLDYFNGKVYFTDRGLIKQVWQLLEDGTLHEMGDGYVFTDSYGIAVDPDTGDVFVANQSGDQVLKIDGTTEAVTAFAGTGVGGFSGDTGLATLAKINAPEGLTVYNGALYIADVNNRRVRRVDLTTNIITTVAGTGIRAFGADNIDALSSPFNDVYNMRFDTDGNIFIVETSRIRKVNASDNKVFTVAGTTTDGFSGDGGPAIDAEFGPDLYGVCSITGGDFFVCDYDNNRVRRVTVANGNIDTFAGTGADSPEDEGDGGPPVNAVVGLPSDMVFDVATGDLYTCADKFIRKFPC